MKNHLTIFLACLLINFNLSAQNLLEGSITNEKGENIVTATIQLHPNTNEAATIHLTVDSDGYFIIENIADGNYWLEVSANDYESVVIAHFMFPKDTDKVLGLTMNRLENTSAIEKIAAKQGKLKKIKEEVYIPKF